LPVPAFWLCDEGAAEVHLCGRHRRALRRRDAYYAAPGHVPTLYAGTEVVEFSPTADLQKTLEVVSRNMEAGVSG
jgi:hypothetical protein